MSPVGVPWKEEALARAACLCSQDLSGNGEGGCPSISSTQLEKKQGGTLSRVDQRAGFNSSWEKMSSGPQVQDRERGKGGRQSQP